ncbi:ABC transporter substrate-binding protein [Actinocorallia sp. A-T 12471]|uniref:ABC transporter substrate-binding protein n=1 Tax=Actinocorallia sp. A-T 12471 TaxID=3089813 RepID=UPI0029CFBC63|nr:ABC transporter substrate-binding protein [Actinocorallia sp. A-T 12471]MDX6741517.1 ABC transporter substrate-binding protein [Actinocorallia sp. A-T 12471]
MKPLALLAAGLTALLGLTACGGGSDDDAKSSGTITIRIPDPGNTGPLAVGKKDGTLDAALAKVNAKVEWAGEFGPFAPAAQAINAGSLDIATGSITSGIGALAVKPTFKIFAVQPPAAGEGILVKENSPISSVADLAGRSVAVNQGGTGEYLLLKALEKNNVPIDKVKRVYLPPADSPAAFNSGQVDAWATWNSFTAPAIANADGKLLVDGDAIDSDNYTIYVVADAFYGKHPEVVKVLTNYLHDGSVKQQADPAPFVNVNTEAGPQAVAGKLKDVTLGFLRDTDPVRPVTADDLARFETVSRFFTEQKVIKQPVDVGAYTLVGLS